MAGNLPIFNISLDESAREVKDLFKNLGVENQLNTIVTNKMEQVTNKALQAAQSKVPVDTETLRNLFIQATPFDGQKSQVYVSGGTHQTIHSPKAKSASTLASLLDAGSGRRGFTGRAVRGRFSKAEGQNELQRSRPSEAVSPFSSVRGSTAGWIEKAQQEFIQNLNRILNGRR